MKIALNDVFCEICFLVARLYDEVTPKFECQSQAGRFQVGY